ncbi:RidA family protein [Nocardia carnea]|uniref:RidA family protein n=1 Tax=Nocardia carnea TaxID=37328 RepID=UPI002455077F|nr:RidA family protein [Nocardia carnea]
MRYVNPPGLPKLPGVASHGVVLESAGLVYTSGQVAWDSEGNLVEGDLEAQFRRAYANIDTVLEAAGSSRGKVVSETVYLAGYSPDRAEELIRTLTAARPAGVLPPASTAVGVETLFAAGFLVEIQVVAAL